MDKILQLISQFLQLGRITQLVSDYVRSQVEVVKLELRAEIARIVAKAVVFIIIVISAFLLLIFIGFAVAEWIGICCSNPYLGYMIVALFYLLVLMFVVIFRKPLARFVERKIQIRIQRPRE
ncbi:MAG: hypothetical protein CRN43_07945 [Candidatus Nephrothrix sp. EaCA]|nr:MAG: hypothetical protein CRN43_07945 [Candidatus Nephrothrix sp. EaCA]